MSVSSAKKFKQAILQFNTVPLDKKRKLSDDTSLDEVKCRKINLDPTRLLSNINQKSSTINNMNLVHTNCDSTSGGAPAEENDVIDLTEEIDSDEEENLCICNINDESLPTTPKQSNHRKSEVSLDLNKIGSNSAGDSDNGSAEKIVTKKATPEKVKESVQPVGKDEREKVKPEKERIKEEKEKERLAKLEEKRQKEELEKKNKEKTAALFTNYFLKCKTASTKNLTSERSEKLTCTRFAPFEVKPNMRVAAVLRASMTSEKLRYLDEVLSRSDLDVSSLYLAHLRSKDYVPQHSENTWPLNSNDDDDEDENHKDEIDDTPRYRCKLLQFAENRRPAFWGTWRKCSKKISGRTPFKLDSEYFEYDVDSDEEWVDEEPGERVDDSDDDQEPKDDYEVDNDMFVPHGYLSDEEGQPDEIPEGSPKSKKQKMTVLEKQFEAEMNEKTSKLRSRVHGCVWIPNEVEKNGRDHIENLLLIFRAVFDPERTPFCVRHYMENSTPTVTPSSKSKITPQNIPKGVLTEFPDSLLVDFIKLVHRNKFSRQKLVDEFKVYALSIASTFNLTKTCLISKLREIASWTPNLGCWMVSDEVRQQHNLGDLSLAENSWKYISNFETPPSKKSQNLYVNGEKRPQATSPVITVTTPTSSGNPKKTNTITKFIRVYRASENEKQQQPVESTTESAAEADK